MAAERGKPSCRRQISVEPGRIKNWIFFLNNRENSCEQQLSQSKIVDYKFCLTGKEFRIGFNENQHYQACLPRPLSTDLLSDVRSQYLIGVLFGNNWRVSHL